MTLRINLLAILTLAMAFGLSFMAQGATSVGLSSCHVKDISRLVKCAEFRVLLDRDGGERWSQKIGQCVKLLF